MNLRLNLVSYIPSLLYWPSSLGCIHQYYQYICKVRDVFTEKKNCDRRKVSLGLKSFKLRIISFRDGQLSSLLRARKSGFVIGSHGFLDAPKN